MPIKKIALWIFILWVALISRPTPSRAYASQVSRSDLIAAMNVLRVSYGLPALIEDPIINSVAQATAEIMAANQMSWHMGDVRGRIKAAGYGGGATVWATENFAVGNMTIDEIMYVWADPDHMLPAVVPAYCHVGAGVAPTSDGKYYYVLQAAYTSANSCGPYVVPTYPNQAPGDNSTSQPASNPVYGIIMPVKVATPDAEGKIIHVVEPGQSLWSIAIAYHVTIRDLQYWNNLVNTVIRTGQELFIPSETTEGYATPTPVGMVVVATPGADGQIIHVVQPYNNLTTIATAYGVSLDTILALNNWQIDWPLQIGQKLVISLGNITPSATPRPLTPLEKLTPASDGKYYHTVQEGQTLSYIAGLYNIPLRDLMAWNGLNNTSIIRPEQKLLLQVTPPPTVTATPLPPTFTATPNPPTFTASATRTALPPAATRTFTQPAEETTPASFPSDPLNYLAIGGVLLIVIAIAGLVYLGVGKKKKAPNE